MNEEIRKLVQQIRALEEELRVLLQEQEDHIFYRVEGTRIEFEKKLRETHQRLKVGVFRWLRSSQPRNVFSAPFIYGMIIPMVIFDISLTLYQFICFRLYQIPSVHRADCMVFDRHQLAYLNLIEKFNCTYCAYGNGLIAYAREITARTEQYWCPIKHAHKRLHPHERYLYFVPYGDGEAFHTKRALYRNALAKDDPPRFP